MLPFIQYAIIGIIILSVASAIIGTYIVTRHMVFISGGITHACFGGLGLGYYLGVPPMLMSALFAVAGSLGVDAIARSGARKDSAIAVVWALGMAIGVLFISLTPGYTPELNSFLFGNVLTITRSDLYIFAAFLAVVILFHILFFPLIVAISFDSDFALTRHLPVRFINTVMTILVAIDIVLSIRLVGIMLLISLISLPQMIAERFARRYITIMIIAAVISLIACLGGLYVAYLINVPASATIVLILILLYIIKALI